MPVRMPRPRFLVSRLPRAAVLAALLGAASPWTVPAADAQAFTLFAGPLSGAGTHSAGWAFDYREGLGKYAAAGFTWYNEGHLPSHHRDGQSVQLWGRLPLGRRRFVLSAGVGPYRYFDTEAAGQGRGYSNTHGWGVLMSVRAAYYGSRRWLLQVQANRVHTFSGPDTTSMMFGIGYQLAAPDRPGPCDYATGRLDRVTNQEVTGMIGETILNSRSSPSSLGASVEYRRGIAKHLDWTATYLYEGSKRQIRRNGVATELWLTRAFLDDRIALAAGAGLYVAVDQRHMRGSNTGDGRLSCIVSISASYRLGRSWLTRLTWKRVVTRYDRDTDVIQAGLGYRF
ncbi:Hypothetical protein bglu_1g30990 [Burkholderia glumae BGR1]|nr:Hypothetical protein bglu_1g30990 [Burkholderia glumae BGR1]UVS91529.1 hypothetical protein EFP17_18280 [Burkholderia glumae]UVT04919.1 hypothetical protein EFP20_27230 [Burkholderia glumae]